MINGGMRSTSKQVRVISVRGMPPDLKQGMESLARRTGSTKSDVYSGAITALAQCIRSGEVIISFPASFPSSRYSVKLPREVVDDADLVIESSPVPLKKSQFVREACRRCLGEDAIRVAIEVSAPAAGQQQRATPCEAGE